MADRLAEVRKTRTVMGVMGLTSFLVIFCAGCGTKVYRMHDLQDASRDQLAVLRLSEGFASDASNALRFDIQPHPWLYAVDGKHARTNLLGEPKRFQADFRPSEVELAPGKHTLLVKPVLAGGNRVYTVEEPIPVEFVAKAGRYYRLRADLYKGPPKTWKVSVVEDTPEAPVVGVGQEP